MSKYSNNSYQWKETRQIVLTRDNHTCMYCGSEATQVDHIIPRSRGGSDELSNLIASCSSCNRLKSDKALMRTQWINPKYQRSITIKSQTKQIEQN